MWKEELPQKIQGIWRRALQKAEVLRPAQEARGARHVQMPQGLRRGGESWEEGGPKIGNEGLKGDEEGLRRGEAQRVEGLPVGLRRAPALHLVA